MHRSLPTIHIFMILCASTLFQVRVDTQLFITTGPPSSVTANAAETMSVPPGCPIRDGILDSISVPVKHPISLQVYVANPAPAGGIRVQLSSGNPSIVTVGDAVQGYRPEVFIPAGQNLSNLYTILGVRVGQTTLTLSSLTPGFVGGTFPMGAWDVNADQLFKFLDANPPVNHCRRSVVIGELSSDPAILSTCGKTVFGAAADGVTRLLMRLSAGLPGTACFQIVSTSPYDQGSVETAVTSTQSVSSTNQAYSFYRTPAYFGASADLRNLEVEFTFTPSIGNGNTTQFRAQTTLVRPPVLLLHGLWDDASTWGGDFLLTNSWRITHADNYRSSNDASFSTNVLRVKAMTNRTLDQMRRKGIGGMAATQVDVIGHSMGGILARLFINGEQNRIPDNLNQGYVRRLVTLDTPHFGSSFANLLVALHNTAPDQAEDMVGLLLRGAKVTGGAICDLAENSPALQALNGGTIVPSYAISATNGPAGSRNKPAKFWLPFEIALTDGDCVEWNKQFTQCRTWVSDFPTATVDGFRFRSMNDAIVSLESQGGGINGTNYTDLLHFSLPVMGGGPTKSSAVATEVYSALDAPVSTFNTAGFPSLEVSRGDGTPRYPVPGRGATLDRADYLAQCSPGGPMKPATAQQVLTQATQPASPQSRATAATASSAAGDPRVRIVSPAAGEQFAPGDTVSIIVEVTPPLAASSVRVGIPGLSPILKATRLSGSQYQVTFVIPNVHAGPMRIVPVIWDTSHTYIRGTESTFAVRPQTAPTGLVLSRREYYISDTPPTSDTITVLGKYSPAVERNLSSAASGTTFRSSNPGVITVDADGKVTTVSRGTAVVYVENSGVKATAVFVVEDPANPLPPQLITTLQTSQSIPVLDSQSGFYNQNLQITYPGGVGTDTPPPIVGPLFVILGGLPADVTLMNGTGLTRAITPTGSPYVAIPIPDGTTLQPGETVTIPLQFLNPNAREIVYSTSVYRTSAVP